MIAPLVDAGLLNDSASLLLALAIGVAFGWALERAGLGNPRKLMGQFTLADLTVLKVMFSAIVTAMLGSFWLARLGWLDLSRVYVPETFVVPQILGGLIFGAGFVVGGLCPGTSCVAAATGRLDGLAVIAGMLAGVTGAGLLLPTLPALFDATPRGALTLPEALGFSYGATVFVVVVVALAGFQAAASIERRRR
jgi:uncharacterized membrane protein YedE/YeeE